MIIISIIFEKILESIKSAPLHRIGEAIGKMFLAMFMFLAILDVAGTWKAAKFVFLFGNMVFPKLLVSILIVFYFYVFVEIYENIKEEILHLLPKEDCKLWHNVPVSEVVDFLFSSGSFSRQNVVDILGVSRSTADKMSASLEAVKILVRGENNSKVLNVEFSRSDVVSILAKNDGGELSPLFRKVSDTEYSHLPSLPREDDETESGFIRTALQQ